MVLTNYVTQILFSLMIGHIFIFTSRAGASADRVQEVLQEEIDIANPLHPDTKPVEDGEVMFENVSFSYAGQKGEPVLRNISFSVESGEMATIVGTTGSGKSTLMYLIPRFYDVTEGRVLIDGEDVRKKDLKTLRAAIGIVPQEPVLFLGTIRENICWGRPDASFEEVVEAARVTQAHDFIATFPGSYDIPSGQRRLTFLEAKSSALL